METTGNKALSLPAQQYFEARVLPRPGSHTMEAISPADWAWLCPVTCTRTVEAKLHECCQLCLITCYPDYLSLADDPASVSSSAAFSDNSGIGIPSDDSGRVISSDISGTVISPEPAW